MRRHEIDAVSVFAGLLFLVVAGVHIVARATDTDLNLRWMVPAVLVLLGALGLLSAVRSPRPDRVVAGTPDDYQDHPTAADVALVMEVSDTTVGYDQTKKAPLYARAGVAEYWILILKTRTLEVRRDPIVLSEGPTGYGYRTLTLYRETDTVTPLNAGTAVIPVAGLLPAQRIDTLSELT